MRKFSKYAQFCGFYKFPEPISKSVYYISINSIYLKFNRPIINEKLCALWMIVIPCFVTHHACEFPDEFAMESHKR